MGSRQIWEMHVLNITMDVVLRKAGAFQSIILKLCGITNLRQTTVIHRDD
jgi:hypothetical protein